jgi:hypothetical protein
VDGLQAIQFALEKYQGGEQERPMAARFAIEGWAKVDVTAAAKFLQNAEASPQSRELMLEQVLNAFQQQQPKQGLAWVDSLSNNRAEAMHAVVSNYLQSTEPERVNDWLKEHAHQPEAHEAITEWAGARAIQSPEPTAQWVTSLPSGPARDFATEAAFAAWAYEAPENAVQWIVDHLQGDPLSDIALAGIISQDLRSNSVNFIIEAWTARDPAAAASWRAHYLP